MNKKVLLGFRRTEIMELTTKHPEKKAQDMAQNGWVLEDFNGRSVRGLCESCGKIVLWEEKYLDYGDCIDCKKCSCFAQKA